ncbi:HalOD1 output domain-containing protein [Natrialbaceae archaeon GCM10025810]|uniref:HalOD1 output domain-containing protein n=1 Tax=Halovalidus salilacus TaxID=3075124 RepID=UPI00361E7F33
MIKPGAYRDERHHLYLPDENRTLSEAVLVAVAEYEDLDLLVAGFRLYDLIDPSALNRLFQFNSDAVATVSFAVSNSYVFLRDIGNGVEIWVSNPPPS